MIGLVVPDIEEDWGMQNWYRQLATLIVATTATGLVSAMDIEERAAFFSDGVMSAEAAVDKVMVNPNTRILQVEFDVENAMPVYEIDYVQGNDRINVEVGAMKGETLNSHIVDFSRELKTQLGENPVTFKEAVAAAKKGDMRLFEAELHLRKGTPHWELKFIRNGQQKTVLVNAKDGTLLP